MRKFTIKELSDAWGVSVPATWKRVDKIKKEDETNGTEFINVLKEPFNNKLTTVIELDESVFNRFFQTANDAQASESSSSASDVVDKIMEYSDLTQARMLDATAKYAEDLKNLMQELANAKASTLLLEDKAGREGIYLQEIKEAKSEADNLKTKNNNLKIAISILSTVLIVSLILCGFLLKSNAEKDLSLKEKQEVQQVIIPDNKPVKSESVTPAKPVTAPKKKK